MFSKRNAIAIIVIVFLALLAGCSNLGYTGTKGGKTKYQDVKTEVVELTITYYSDMQEKQYTFTKTGEGAFFFSKNNADVLSISEEVFDELNAWIDTYDIKSWDGYDMTQKNVKDGSSFRLEIELATGETITSHGSNARPKGYEEANSSLKKIIEGMKDQY